jgi:hypothetical protein
LLFLFVAAAAAPEEAYDYADYETAACSADTDADLCAFA